MEKPRDRKLVVPQVMVNRILEDPRLALKYYRSTIGPASDPCKMVMQVSQKVYQSHDLPRNRATSVGTVNRTDIALFFLCYLICDDACRWALIDDPSESLHEEKPECIGRLVIQDRRLCHIVDTT